MSHAVAKATAVASATPRETPLGAALFTGAPVGVALLALTVGAATVTPVYVFASTPTSAPLLAARTVVKAVANAADGAATM